MTQISSRGNTDEYFLLPFLLEIGYNEQQSGILETEWKSTKPKMSKGIKKLKFPDHSDEDIKGPLQCYRCGDIFKSLKLVQDHLTEKHKSCRKIHYGKERQYQCHICKAMFKSEEQKSYHRCRVLEENQAGVYRRSIFKIRPNCILIGRQKLRLRPKDRSQLFFYLIFLRQLS